MTAIERIRKDLFRGRTMTTMDAFIKYRTTKLPNRLREIELSTGIEIERTKVVKNNNWFFKYKLDIKKNEEKIKELKKQGLI